MPSHLDDLRHRTLALMRELGSAHAGRPLQDLGWTFRWDRAKRRLGACRIRGDGKTLSLSAPHARRGGWDLMEDVARHEIAHALHYELEGGRGHGPDWQRWARRCGASPTRVYEGDAAEALPTKYAAVCPRGCGYEIGFHRRVRRWYYCPRCSAEGRGKPKAFLHLVERATGEVVRPGGVGARPPA